MYQVSDYAGEGHAGYNEGLVLAAAISKSANISARLNTQDFYRIAISRLRRGLVIAVLRLGRIALGRITAAVSRLWSVRLVSTLPSSRKLALVREESRIRVVVAVVLLLLRRIVGRTPPVV